MIENRKNLKDLKTKDYINNIEMSNNKISLCHFGPGWVFDFLDDYLLSKFDVYILIDGLPTKIKHYDSDQEGYKKCKDFKTFKHTLISELIEYNFKLVEHNKKLKLLRFKPDNHKQELLYYYDTTVQESLDDPVIRAQLNQCIWLHMKGFNPYYEYGLMPNMLPNLLHKKSELKEYLKKK